MRRRIVMITGASSGIGKEIARLLARRGDFPLLIARNTRALQALQAEIATGAVYSCDVTQEEDVRRFVNEAIRRYERVDVLVNSAGVGYFGGVLDVTPSEYRKMMETNYMGAVNVIRAVLPHMLRQGGGRILNIASVAGLTGIPNLAGYTASKFALIGFSESLRMEYAPRIQVGVLCPGPVNTSFFLGEDPFSLFPSPIARQLIDVQTVAATAVRLIDRPRVKVIPFSMRWAMRLRHIVPGLYVWATRKMYSSLQTSEAGEPLKWR